MAKNNSTSNTIQLPLPIDGATVEIQLTKGYVTIIDAVDADLAQYDWHIHQNKCSHYACRTIRNEGKKYDLHLHTIILERKLGRQLLPNELTDHEDMNSMNNRRYNLRPASKSQNNSNRIKSKKNTSGYKGVVRHGKAWQAQIKVNSKKITLGSFDNPEEAHAAYCEASKKYHGEFGRFD